MEDDFRESVARRQRLVREMNEKARRQAEALAVRAAAQFEKDQREVRQRIAEHRAAAAQVHQWALDSGSVLNERGFRPFPLVRFTVDAPAPRRRERVRWHVHQRAAVVDLVWPLNVGWGCVIDITDYEGDFDCAIRVWHPMFVTRTGRIGFFSGGLKPIEFSTSTYWDRFGSHLPSFGGGSGYYRPPAVRHVEHRDFGQVRPLGPEGLVYSHNTCDGRWISFDPDQPQNIDPKSTKPFDAALGIGAVDNDGVPLATNEAPEVVVEDWLQGQEQPGPALASGHLPRQRRMSEPAKGRFGGAPRLEPLLALGVADYLENGPVLHRG